MQDIVKEGMYLMLFWFVGFCGFLAFVVFTLDFFACFCERNETCFHEVS